MGNYLVADPLTVIVPAVPLDTYPAVTVGVMLYVPLTVAVIFPEVLTEIVGFLVTVVAGVAAFPVEIDFVAYEA